MYTYAPYIHTRSTPNPLTNAPTLMQKTKANALFINKKVQYNRVSSLIREENVQHVHPSTAYPKQADI